MSHLYRFARLLQVKYLSKTAQSAENQRSSIVEHIKQAVVNASSWGQKTHGIMPFMQMLQQDGATLSLNLVKQGKSISVTGLTVSNPALIAKYQPLGNQVKNYLEKNWELFPNNVEYGSGFAFTLEFAPEGNSQAIR